MVGFLGTIKGREKAGAGLSQRLLKREGKGGRPDQGRTLGEGNLDRFSLFWRREVALKVLLLKVSFGGKN